MLYLKIKESSIKMYQLLGNFLNFSIKKKKKKYKFQEVALWHVSSTLHPHPKLLHYPCLLTFLSKGYNFTTCFRV